MVFSVHMMHQDFERKYLGEKKSPDHRTQGMSYGSENAVQDNR